MIDDEVNTPLKRLLVELLQDYADKLGCNGCNDWEWPDYITEECKSELASYFKTVEQGDYWTDFMVVVALSRWVKSLV